MTATAREQIKERLGVTEVTPGVTPVDELTRRLRAISPEVLAGDPEAVAEADRITVEIEAEQRRAKLEALAASEQANRERAAAEKEAEKVRAAAARKLAKLDTQRNAKLVAIEAAIDNLEWVVADYAELEFAYADLRKKVDPDSVWRHWMVPITDRLARRFRASILPDLDLPRGSRGLEPLGGVETTPE